MSKSAEPDPMEMVLEDNHRFRKAGNELAIAAIHVAKEFDGVHRLMLAVSKWAKAVADEGRREQLTEKED